MILEYPLTKANRIRLACAFRDAARVDLTIPCIIEGQMGKACVDDLERPNAFMIQTGPFVYFAGDSHSIGGQEMIAGMTPEQLIMPSTEGWIEGIRDHFGARLREFDRYSFSAETLSRDHLQALLNCSPYQNKILEMDEAFATCSGNHPEFIILDQFDSPADFVQRGIGFYLLERGDVAGAAYSSLSCSQGIEVSIFVQERYRQRGMATALASQLLLQCLHHRLEPHWDAANPESCKLALKLGYKYTDSYLAYYLGEE
jgi:GNAT superfamily N-acetyltransferase